MARETRNAVLASEVRTLFGYGVARDSSDRELLERFLTRDHVEAEAAFTVLVERHGPMVLHVCRQVLNDSHDAQDAFQATFLILLRKAQSIRSRDSLASWLFGVAMRVARRARYAAVARRFHERHAGERTAASSPAANENAQSLVALHNEIARLPDRYREPIVLCYLEGLSTAVAAQRLGCAQGTVLSRLARGRERLRRRLSQGAPHGFAGPFLYAGLPRETIAAVPSDLLKSTLQYVGSALSGHGALVTTAIPTVVALTNATLRPLFMGRIMFAGASLAAAVAMTVVAVPILRPRLRAAAHGLAVAERPKQNQANSPTFEQEMRSGRDLAEAFYRILERDHEFNDPRWPFVIKIRDLQGMRLIDATFKHRVKGRVNEFDAVIQAKRATLRFDLQAKIVRAFLEDAEVQRLARDADVVLIKNDILEIPIPREVEEPAEGRIVKMDSDQALSLGYGHDGKTLATAGFDGVVHLWDAVTGRQVAQLDGETKATIRSVTFTRDGKFVACVNDAGLVRVWDVGSAALKQTLVGLSEPMREATRTFMLDSVDFSPDGHLIAVSGFGPTRTEPPDRIYELRVFDVHAGKPKWSHMGRGEQACSLTFAPDGKTLARAGWKSVTLWNADDGEPIRTLYPTKGTIFALAFTPDGNTLVGGGNITTPDPDHQAGLVTLWDVATGQIIRALEGHRGGVHAVAIAPDGKTIASGGDGPIRSVPGVTRVVSEVRLWDIATGRLLWTFEGELGVVRGLAFAPDGKTVIYCDDGAVGIIRVETGKLERILTKTTLRPQTP
jgi:RNA polymerase sigma factor (sigma-70 family)